MAPAGVRNTSEMEIGKDSRVARIALELKVVLEQEASILSNLLELMHAERELLIKFQIDNLSEVNKNKELLVLQHSYIDQGRRKLTGRLAEELGSDEDPTLSLLIGSLEGKTASSLSTTAENLRQLVQAIQKMSAENCHLIEASLQSVRGTLAQIERRLLKSETYSINGVITQELSKLASLNARA